MPTIAGSTWSRNCLHYWILGGLFWILGISWAKSRPTKEAPSNFATQKPFGKNIQNVVTMIFLLIRFLKFTSLIKSQWLLLITVISRLLGKFFYYFFSVFSSQFWIYMLWNPWSGDLSDTQITVQVCLYIRSKSENMHCTWGVSPCLFMVFIGLPLSIFKSFPSWWTDFLCWGECDRKIRCSICTNIFWVWILQQALKVE